MQPPVIDANILLKFLAIVSCLLLCFLYLKPHDSENILLNHYRRFIYYFNLQVIAALAQC
jgi:hypothetical protein